MPYISLSTSKKLAPEQKEAVKSKLGELITIIPGKSEGGLMIDIGDGRTFYFRGIEKEAAYINVKMRGTAEYSVKKELTEALFAMFDETLGLKPDDVYISYEENEHWGLKGQYV